MVRIKEISPDLVPQKLLLEADSSIEHVKHYLTDSFCFPRPLVHSYLISILSSGCRSPACPPSMSTESATYGNACFEDLMIMATSFLAFFRLVSIALHSFKALSTGTNAVANFGLTWAWADIGLAFQR